MIRQPVLLVLAFSIILNLHCFICSPAFWGATGSSFGSVYCVPFVSCCVGGVYVLVVTQSYQMNKLHCTSTFGVKFGNMAAHALPGIQLFVVRQKLVT